MLLAGGTILAAAERTVAPTYLYRRLPDLVEKKADVTTSTCHYRPIFGVGDQETRILRSVARFGEIIVDPGGVCAVVNYPREEQVFIVTDGTGMVQYGSASHSVKRNDYMYLPPTVSHGIRNPSKAELRVFVMGWKIPKGVDPQIPSRFLRDNIDNVPLQSAAGHPKSAQFRLLMGATDSKRDRIAAGNVLTSLFVMQFTPGGTNFPHHHEREEEFYIVLSGKGKMVAGGGMDGIMGLHPAVPGDAYFFRLNCTVGFYASKDPADGTARILAARSLFPRWR